MTSVSVPATQLAGPPTARLLVHQFRRDLKHLYPVVIVWLASLGLHVASFFLERPGLDTFGTLARVLSMYALVAMLVQLDPLVGRDPFWRTRPLPISVLLGGKAAFVALLVFLPTIACHAIQLTVLDLPAGAFPRVLALSALWLVTSLVVAAAVAAATGSLGRFALAWIGAHVFAFALMMPLARIPTPLRAPDDPSGWNSVSTVAVILLLALAVAGAAVAGLIGRRRTPVAVVLAMVAMLALIPFTRGLEHVLTQTFLRDKVLPAETARVSFAAAHVRSFRGTTSLQATLDFEVPEFPDRVVGSYAYRGNVELSDGRVRPSATVQRAHALTGKALHDAVLDVTRGTPRLSALSRLTAVPPGAAVDQIAIDLEVDIGLLRVSTWSLPLEEGTRVDHGRARFTVGTMETERGFPSTVLQITLVGFYRRPVVILRNRARKEVAAFSGREYGMVTVSPVVLWPRVWVHRIDLRGEMERPPNVQNAPKASPVVPEAGDFRWVRSVSDEWFREAEIVVIETAFEGKVTQRLQRDGVKPEVVVVDEART